MFSLQNTLFIMSGAGNETISLQSNTPMEIAHHAPCGSNESMVLRCYGQYNFQSAQSGQVNVVTPLVPGTEAYTYGACYIHFLRIAIDTQNFSQKRRVLVEIFNGVDSESHYTFLPQRRLDSPEDLIVMAFHQTFCFLYFSCFLK